jgi:hypothetical protein
MEGWNSHIWNSNIEQSHLWNSNIEKSDIWNPGISSHNSDSEFSPDSDSNNFENLNEILGAKNFWVLPNGNIKEVDSHLNWIIDNVEKVLAIELLTAIQAIEFRRPLKSSEQLEKIIVSFRQEISFNESDRILHDDMMKSVSFLKNYKLN